MLGERLALIVQKMSVFGRCSKNEMRARKAAAALERIPPTREAGQSTTVLLDSGRPLGRGFRSVSGQASAMSIAGSTVEQVLEADGQAIDL